MTLGQKISTLRNEKELTQKELAAKLGISTGIVAEWEANEATPTLAELSRLSKAFGVSSDILLDAAAETTLTPSAQPAQEEIPIVVPAKKLKKIGCVIGALALCTALIAAGLVLWSQGVFTPEPLLFADDTDRIETADASVVTIFCYDYEGELAATGSGFVAFDGKTIITNYHVMTSAYTCKISTNQDISYDVSEILCYSKEQDIAILQLAKDTGLQPLTLGDSSVIKKGETVVAIGSPLGIKNTVSTGILSGRLMEDNMDVLQFTAPISSGSSGGALFDNSGNVIGITYASYIDGQNLNLAIPIELASSLYKTGKVYADVSSIYLAEHPYVAFLKENKDILEVTITDLQISPKLYDGKTIKLTTYVSSYSPNSKDRIFVAKKENISTNYNYDYDLYWNTSLDFESIPCMYCAFVNGAVVSNFAIGDKVNLIGTFEYTAKGEEYPYYGGGTYENSFGAIYALYIYLD